MVRKKQLKIMVIFSFILLLSNKGMNGSVLNEMVKH